MEPNTNKMEKSKIEKLGDIVKNPKGILQKTFVFIIRILLKIIAKIFPEISYGGDCGMIFHLRDNGKNREAVEFGCKCLEKKLANPIKGRVFSNEMMEMNNWFLLSATLECASNDPKPEDEDIFDKFIRQLGIEIKSAESSKIFCYMAGLTWQLNKPEECWQWVELAVSANQGNAYAYYLKGWHGALSNRDNPVENLFKAVTIDSTYLRRLRQDETLAEYPDFIKAVESRASKAGIFIPSSTVKCNT